MAPKRGTTPSAAATGPSASPALAGRSSKASSNAQQSWQQVVLNLGNYYNDKTPQRTKLLDAFMFFLVVVGGLQFVYCVLAGNYPFNAFLSGFSATVGQFVLTGECPIGDVKCLVDSILTGGPILQRRCASRPQRPTSPTSLQCHPRGTASSFPQA